MKKKIFNVLVLCLLSAVSALAIEYPDYYCSDAAWSYSLPNTLELDGRMPEDWGYYTVGRYKIGDFYYDIINEEKREAAIVTKEKVFETTVGSEIAGMTPSVKDWPCTNFEGDIEVPSQVMINNITYDIVMIGYGVFYGSENLRSVKVPESVRFISSHVFYKCNNLREIIIPDGTYIAPKAILYCPLLEKLDLSRCKMERLCLYDNFNLKTVILPKFLIDGHIRIELSRITADIWSTESVVPQAGLISLSSPGNLESYDGTLYVPRGSAQSYMEHWQWCRFPNIVEYDVLGEAGVERIEATNETTTEYYDMLGRRVSGTEPGLYLRRSGNKTEKVIVGK